jgi:hypothetical protein
MNISPRLRRFCVFAALLPLLLAVQPRSWVDSRAKNAKAQSVHAVPHQPPKPQETMNAWTVGLAGGLLEGGPIASPRGWPAWLTMETICMSCRS